MLTLNDGRSELWQWDTGRTLTVDADCSQVHFSNKVFGRSIDVDVIDGVSIIPDILLQTDKDLNAWAFVGTAENGYTKISKTFKVNRRNKPAYYVFTPPDQTSLEEIKEKIDYLESIQDPDAIKNAVDDYLANNPIMVKETDPTVFDWAKKELFNKANFVDPANRNTFVTIDGVEYYRYHCSAQNFEYHNPKPFPGSVTITIRTMSQYTNGVSGIVLHYADGTSEVIYPERGVVTIYTTDASKTFAKMSGRYDMENWNLIDMSVMSIQANYNIGIPVANANAPGGIKAEPATEADTQPVRIGADGMLYTAPGGGVPENGETVAAPLPLLADVTSEEALSHFEVTLSKRAVRRVLVQISVPASEAVGAVCYGALNGGMWDGYIFGSTALAANSRKWLELELMEGGLAKYTVSESSGNLWSLNMIKTAGALEKISYVDSIGIRVNGSYTAPAGTRLQVWGE